MAEFLNQQVPEDSPEVIAGFEAMGKPIPDYRKDAGYQTCRKAFGMDANKSFGTVQGCADALERDEPYKAMEAAMKYGLDLTGAYRLMAVLLTAEEESD